MKAKANAIPAQAGDDQPFSPAVEQQIQALIAEKESRTPAQQKIDSQLLYALKMERGESIANGVDSLSVNVGANEQGRVVVDIAGTIDDSLLGLLADNGANILNSTPAYNSIRVEVGLDRLEIIADSPAVRFIQPEQDYTTNSIKSAGGEAIYDKPSSSDFSARASRVREQLKTSLTNFNQDETGTFPGGSMTNSVGSRGSEGDVTHRANTARTTFNTDGTGVRIGVLSNGVTNIGLAQASGDLPPDVTILPGQAGSGDEGTAMLEIVHDLAPGAKLYFATASLGIASFSQNIRDLRNVYHCDIIVDDVFFFVETPFQDGQLTPSNTNGAQITQAVNDVTANGALYFSSAGNSGNKDDGTSGVWEGDFNDGGASAAPLPLTGNVHDFDPATAGTQFDIVTTVGSGRYSLFWSDPLGGSTNDYDLFALNTAQTSVVASSTNIQNGTQDPYEFFSPSASNTRLVVLKKTGAANRFLHLETNRGTLSINTPGVTSGHSISAQAYSVAATPAFLPFGASPPNPTGPFPGVFSAANQTELFSSDGPRRIFYQPDGTPYTPGNFSSTGGTLRQKPDITAADGVSVTGVGNFGSPFYGTSAAAPHAAAIAGLVKSANTALTPAQIRMALISSAIDIETPGVDRDTGAGIIMAYQALQASGATGTADLEVGTVTATEIGGNGNGFVEPGERGSLSIQLNNFGVNNATGITATLTSNTPGVTVTPPGTSAYPDIPATNGSGVNTTPFQFVISGSAACPGALSFTLTVTYAGGPSPKALAVTVSQSVVINETLDTTAPTNGVNYTATSGVQVGRLARSVNSTQSSCGALKANPGLNDTINHRYDAYTFTNNSSSQICVSISLTTSAAAINNLQSAAYAPSFIPTSITENYLGDIAGNGPGVTRTYSVNIPANTTFVVTVNEVTAGVGIGTAYTLQVDGLPSCGNVGIPVNQPPVNTVPGAQTTNEDTPLVFSSGNSNQISVADPDAGNNPLQVTLGVNNGTLSLSTTAGLTFTAGDGTADPTMTFTGTTTNINAALNGLSFTPTANFSGGASLTITTNDQNFTGSGGPKTDTDSVSITINPVNDVPTANAQSVSTNENTPVPITLTGSDLETAPGSLTFAVTVQPAHGTLSGTAPNLTYTPTAGYSGPDSFKFTVTDTGQAPSPAATSAEATVSITINPGGTFQFSSPTYSVSENTSIATITVSRTGGSNGTATVNYATSGGPATAGLDYIATSGTLTFNNGETSKTFNVAIINDTFDEVDENVGLTLSSAGGTATLGTPATAVLTIVDDDVSPSLSINDVSVSEGNSGTTNAVFTVTLSAPSNLIVRADFATANGTATAGSDYQSTSGTVTFNAGETTKTITVAINGDTGNEPDETFFVNLSNPFNSTISDSQGGGTILNDDGPAVQLSSSTYTVAEDGLHVVVTANRSGDTTGAATVDYATSDPAGLTPCNVFNGIASQRCDYATVVGTLRFAAGETSKTIFIPVIDDSYVEGDESFSITLSNPTGATLGSTSSATITILSNDNSGGANPIANNSFFVREHYIDFLGREPDPAGLQGWLNVLNNCGTTVQQPCDRIEVSADFFRSDEFQQRGYFIYRFYSASLGRIPHYSEFIPDIARVSGFLNAQELEAAKVSYIQDFMNRTEFKTKYDPTINNPTAYVNLLEQTAGVTLSNKQALITGLQNGTETRATVLRKVIESPEVTTKFFNEAFVVEAYFGYLRRDPDAAYLQWVQTLNQTGGYRTLVNGFLNSNEYVQRFGQ